MADQAAKMRPSHRRLAELTHLPTTSGREWRVVEWVRRWGDRRPDVRIQVDQAGNLMLDLDRHSETAPVVLVAHMDHPGFVVTAVGGREVAATFMGGVLPQYFKDAPVELFDGSDDRVTGKVVWHDPDNSQAHILLSGRRVGLATGDVGRWRYPPRAGVYRGLLRAPACDDLAGVAAALEALDRARKRSDMDHIGLLLTRAEEEGFVGAIAACRLGSLPADARILSIETSPTLADAPIGAGPIVRVGDRSSIFDAPLSNRVSAIAAKSGLPHQRRLMDGGSCEATAFGAYGLAATGLCLALGNHHNMVDRAGVTSGTAERAILAPEEISLDDFDGLVSLLARVVREIDDETDDARQTMERIYQSRGHILDA